MHLYSPPRVIFIYTYFNVPNYKYMCVCVYIFRPNFKLKRQFYFKYQGVAEINKPRGDSSAGSKRKTEADPLLHKGFAGDVKRVRDSQGGSGAREKGRERERKCRGRRERET